MRHVGRCSALLLVLALTSPTFAATKAPWLWTTEERERDTKDPEKRAQRIQENREFRKRMPPMPPLPPLPGQKQPRKVIEPDDDAIDGNLHPELFYVTELFENLVTSSFLTLPQIYPRVVVDRSSDLFRAPGEWAQFTEIVAEYATLLQRERQLVTTASRATPEELAAINRQLASLRVHQCVAGSEALRKARQAFGKERFDRMLYEVVPPGRGRGVLLDPKTGEDLFARHDRACQ